MKTSMEPLKVSLSTDHLYSMLQKDTKWQNKDLAKLISDKSTQKGDTVNVEQAAVVEDLSDEMEDS